MRAACGRKIGMFGYMSVPLTYLLNLSSLAQCISRWLDIPRRIWHPSFSSLSTLAALSFGPRLKRYDCVVPRTNNSFSAASPRVWNALSTYLRQDISSSQ